MLAPTSALNDRSSTASPRTVDQTVPPLPAQRAPHGLHTVLLQANEVAAALATVQTFVAAGQREPARVLLRRLIATVPSYDQPWLQLLALDPPPAEELELLDGFLQQHPHHRFVPACHARRHSLQETQRIVALLQDSHHLASPSAHAAPSLRLGEYLLQQGLVTPEQIEQALVEQRRLRSLGIDERLGTLLLLSTDLVPEQLRGALGSATTAGFGEFGQYLVESGRLTAAQVSAALAQQTALAAVAHRAYLQARASYHRNPLRRWLRKPTRRPVPKLGEVVVSMGLLTARQVDEVMRERETAFYQLFA